MSELKKFSPTKPWRKSVRSQQTNCVEVSLGTINDVPAIGVRDSKDPNGSVLAFTREEWAAFTGGVRDGEFDFA